MATMGMAYSVLEHAEHYSAVGRWETVADLWTAEEILEELNDVEETSQTPFLLDDAAICHFDGLIHAHLARRGRR